MIFISWITIPAAGNFYYRCIIPLIKHRQRKDLNRMLNSAGKFYCLWGFTLRNAAILRKSPLPARHWTGLLTGMEALMPGNCTVCSRRAESLLPNRSAAIMIGIWLKWFFREQKNLFRI